MKKGITIDDVAKQAGVSPATVSRVLNNNRNVLPELRSRVLEAAKKLSYKPNYFSKALASKRSDSIGMLVRAFGGFYYGEILQSFEREIRTHNKHLLVASGGASIAEEESGLNTLLTRGCDAIILFCEYIPEHRILEINESGIPVISVNRRIESLENQCIAFDTVKASNIITRYLLDLGHRHIAFITGKQSDQYVIDRITGYRQAYNEYKLTVNSQLLIESGYSAQDSHEATLQLLQSGLEFSAVIYFNDELALPGLKTLQNANLSIPEDISVISFDNHHFSPYYTPPLTTVANPAAKTGRVLAQMAVSLLSGGNLINIEEIQPELVVRESTAKPRALSG